MGEPIFSTKAHVFQIDPDTKKKWMPSSSQAISVSFYHDSNRQIYRIISIEGSKILINSTIMPSMTFTKTSQKFGQWSDAKADTIYGLGFSNEQDLFKFIETFNDIKEMTSQMEDKEINGLSDNLTAKLTPRGGSPTIKPLNEDDFEKKMTPSSIPCLLGSGTQSIEQLCYENDRLMVALTQSRANAKKWEVELQTLRNNNLRLNAALVESASNVEQWKQQLISLKEENIMLKKELVESEQHAGNSEHLQSQLTEVTTKLEIAERLVEDQSKELTTYQSRIEELLRVDVQSQILEKKIQSVEEENVCLKKDLIDLKLRLEKAKSGGVRDNRELLNLQQQLSIKINEMYVLNDHLAELI